MQARRLFLTALELSLVLLVTLTIGEARLTTAPAGPAAALSTQDGSLAATPRSQAVSILPLIIKGWLVWVPDTPTPTPTLPNGPSEFELEVWRLVNQERAANGLPALAWASELWCAARAHSVDMATYNCFSHYGCLDNSAFWERIARCGYQLATGGENIGGGFPSPASVVQGWMASSGHRANILNPNFRDLGVGYAYNQNSTYRHYWTLDLATRSGQSSAASISMPEPLSAESATPTPTASPVPTGDLGWQSIYGTVRGASTSTPIPLPEAVVSYTHTSLVNPGGSGSTTTGTDGRYSFNPIYLHDTDSVTVRAAATGYAAQEQQRSGLQVWYNPVFDFVLAPWTPTPTPTGGFHIYLPLIMKGWLTWLPGTPTLTPTPTPSATPTNTPTSTSTATPTPLPARLEIASLICEGADERVIITNSGSQAQVMTGWRIESVVGPQWYDFHYDYTLAAGATVCVHSGPRAIDNPPSDLLWTYRHIWNDDGDEAVLEDPTGHQVDSRCCAVGCHP